MLLHFHRLPLAEGGEKEREREIVKVRSLAARESSIFAFFRALSSLTVLSCNSFKDKDTASRHETRDVLQTFLQVKCLAYIIDTIV